MMTQYQFGPTHNMEEIIHILNPLVSTILLLLPPTPPENEPERFIGGSPPELINFSLFLLQVKVSVCRFNASFLANPLPHIWQIWGNTGMWALWCLRKSEERRNDQAQSAQKKGFSPSCKLLLLFEEDERGVVGWDEELEWDSCCFARDVCCEFIGECCDTSGDRIWVKFQLVLFELGVFVADAEFLR